MNDIESLRKVTSFDFADSNHRKKIKDWLIHIIFKVEDASCLGAENQEKLLELLNKIHDDEIYKIPRKRGDRSGTVFDGNKELIAWYFIKIKNDEKLTYEDATKKTAEKFLYSEKTVQAFCTEKRPSIERRIQKNGMNNVSQYYEEMLETILKK